MNSTAWWHNTSTNWGVIGLGNELLPILNHANTWTHLIVENCALRKSFLFQDWQYLRRIIYQFMKANHLYTYNIQDPSLVQTYWYTGTCKNAVLLSMKMFFSVCLSHCCFFSIHISMPSRFDYCWSLELHKLNLYNTIMMGLPIIIIIPRNMLMFTLIKDNNLPTSYRHYNDFIMSAMASQITSVSMVRSTVCSGADQRKHQSSASLAFVRGIHR